MKRRDHLFIAAVVAFFIATVTMSNPSAQVTVIQQIVAAAKVLAGDGTAAAPSNTYNQDTDTGSYRIGANNEGFTAGGTLRWDYNTARMNLSSGYGLTFNAGSGLYDGGANIIEQRNGTNGQTFRVYKTYANSGTDHERGAFTWNGNNFEVGTEAGGTGTQRSVIVKGAAVFIDNAGTSVWQFSGGNLGAVTDNLRTIGATGANRPSQIFIAGPSITTSGATGLTITDTGSVRTLTSKVTLDRTNAGFQVAALTADVTIATLPANTQLVEVFASLTTTFACSATCTTATLSGILGKGAGGAEYLASFDADASTIFLGDADAEMGTLMTRAAAIQGGTFTTGSQNVVFRLTSGTGNIGTGAATNLSQGSITFWITTRVLQ